MDKTDITIPPEVVEASGLRLYKMKTKDIKAAIALAINAWPGMQLSCLTVEVSGRKILLPLPATQEPSDG